MARIFKDISMNRLKMTQTLVDKLQKIIAVGAMSVLLAGCGHAVKPNITLPIDMSADSTINQQHSVYLLVVNSDQFHFVSSTYSQIVASLSADRSDVIGQYSLLPGQMQKISISTPTATLKGVAVYALFSQPGKHWKAFIPKDQLSHGVCIKLQKNQLHAAACSHHFWDIF